MAETQKQIVEYRPATNDLKGQGPVSDAPSAQQHARAINEQSLKMMQANPTAVPESIPLIGYGRDVLVGGRPSSTYMDPIAEQVIETARQRVKDLGPEQVTKFQPSQLLADRGETPNSHADRVAKVDQQVKRDARIVELSSKSSLNGVINVKSDIWAPQGSKPAVAAPAQTAPVEVAPAVAAPATQRVAAPPPRRGMSG